MLFLFHTSLYQIQLFKLDMVLEVGIPFSSIKFAVSISFFKLALSLSPIFFIPEAVVLSAGTLCTTGLGGETMIS